MINLPLIHPRPHEHLCGKVPLVSCKSHDKGLLEHLDIFMLLNPCGKLAHILPDISPLYGGNQFISKPSQLFLLFHENHLKPLVSKGLCSCHPGNTPTDHKGPPYNRDPLFMEGV